MLTLGIDEAGRGPCIGSMFITGTLFEEDQLEKLKKIGVRDSKLLTHKRRVELAEKIKRIAKAIKTIEVKPSEIDDAVNGNNSLNLNWLEAIKQADIINELNPHRVIIDCPSPNIGAYTNFLKKYIRKDLLNKIELIVRHKADRDFIECSSSSIIAKVTRDMKIDELKKKYGDFGSGYPSDPDTVRFLRNNWKKYPEIFRKSWESYKRLGEKKESLLSFIRKL